MFELPTIDPPIDGQGARPPGLRLRPYAGEADVAVTVEILNHDLQFDHVPAHEDVAEVASRYRTPSEMFNPARDVTIAEIDGQPVAFGERSWVDTSDGQFREYRCDGAVLPEWRRRGIGRALMAENMRLQRELAATHLTERPRVFGTWTSDRQDGANALARENGFEQVRWFFEMTRDLSQPIPDVPLPEGLEVRPVTMDQIRTIWLADVEAFQDHWGGFDSSEENLQRWLDSPSFDPSLWIVAWDGDQVAGGVINGIHPEENEALGVSRGWLHSVFTRRPWRKRGLARALIARSLVLIKERGIAEGILGVDADNPTGALGLYEKIGFEVLERSTAWRKPFERVSAE